LHATKAVSLKQLLKLLFCLGQIKPVHRFSESQVGVDTGNDNPCIDCQQLDAHKGDADIDIDDQALSRIVSMTSARLLGEGRSRYRLLGPRWVTVINSNSQSDPSNGCRIASCFLADHLRVSYPPCLRLRHQIFTGTTFLRCGSYGRALSIKAPTTYPLLARQSTSTD
jgi:hypothetical protein